MEKQILFQQQLTYSPNSPEELGLLTADSLSWWSKGQMQQISLENILGVSPIKQEDNLFCLQVFTCPVAKSKLSRQKRRLLKEYRFFCPSLEVRSQWHKAILNTSLGKLLDADIKSRHLQIIINPASGKKKAARIFARVQPLLDASNLDYSITQTHSAEDTKDFIYSLDLSKIDGLVIVGGDGTIHDAIAGLMCRPDWETAIKLPLGIIPAGTGNGLSKTLLESAGESYDPVNAAFTIVKGKQCSFDLARVKQNNAKFYSFLSLSWGLISDVDIESEKLKFLGAWRFDLYALMLICFLRTYKGRFSFIPHPDCKISATRAISTKGKWHVIEDEFVFLWGMNTAWAAHDMNVTPYAELNDGAMDILVMRKGTSRLEILKALLRCGKGQHLDLPHMEYYKVRAFRLEPLTDKGILVVDGEPVDYSPIEMKVIPDLACVNY